MQKITSAGSNLSTEPKRRMTPEHIEMRTNQVKQVIDLIQSKAMACVKACKQVGISNTSFLDYIEADTRLIELYARAMAIRSDIKAEKILKLAHNRKNDFYTDQDGNIKPNPVAVQRDRLIIDSEKWLLAKLAPRKYGDRINIDAQINVQQPLSIDQVNDILKQLDENVIDISHTEEGNPNR